MSFSELKKYVLGDIIDIKHGFAFKGEFFSKTETEDVLLSPGNFKIGGGFKDDKFKYYNGNYPKEYILKENDIIVTMTDLSKEGDTLGYSAKIPFSGNKKYLHNQRLGLVQFKNEEFDKNFIYWLLRTKEYQSFIVNSATGTTVKHTAPSRIKEYEFLAPNKITQTKIANILSSLDEKIELNRQTNQTLETIAQTLFKEICLPKSEVLPDGWSVRKISDIGKVITGKTPSSKKPQDFGDKIPFVTPTDFKNYGKMILSSIRYLSDEGINGLKNKVLPKKSVIVTCIGSDMGKVAINQFECVTNQQINSVIVDDYFVDFLYYSLLDKYDLLRNMATGGSTMPMINKSQFEEIKLIIPDNTSLNNFKNIIEPFNSQMKNNILEVETLTELRDSLLPKLMKGEIEINNL